MARALGTQSEVPDRNSTCVAGEIAAQYFPSFDAAETFRIFILMQRNPYAVAEGIRRRAQLSIERCIQHWIRCAQQQMRNEKTLHHAINLNYEELSDQPESCRKKIINFIPELDDIDIRKDVAVHSLDGHIRQPIVNYNQKQIALLSKEDLAEINRHLDKVPEVMAHFGYDYVRG